MYAIRSYYEHAWDGIPGMSSCLLLNAPLHADTHLHPARPFDAVRVHAEAPKLEMSYSTLAFRALIPPS